MNSTKFFKCDITIESEVQEMFKTVKVKFGRLDVLFNNAGIAASGGRFDEIPMEAVRTNHYDRREPLGRLVCY